MNKLKSEVAESQAKNANKFNKNGKSKNTLQQVITIDALPSYYVTTSHPLIAKDSAYTEDYKRKLKRMTEGPPKFYTGFVFDLE